MAQHCVSRKAFHRCRMLIRTCLLLIECVEIIDELSIKVLNEFGVATRKWPEKATLFFKFQGSEDSIRETSRYVESAIAKHGATDYQLASNEQESEDIWQDRRNALFACLAYRPGCKG